MSDARRVLLINPTIASAKNARFPLAVLNLAAALEGRYASTIIDGNVDRDCIATAEREVARGDVGAVGISVMGGPQLTSGIAVSKAIRATAPNVPIIWGGYFPTISTDAALRVPYVDYVVRRQGEKSLVALLDVLFDGRGSLSEIDGLSWRADEIVHNKDQAFTRAGYATALPYERLGNPRRYLPRTCLGRRTAGYQAALGCRFRCTFCGVAKMFRGKTALPPAERLERDLAFLKHDLGADSIQFYDHNFFDREVDMLPLLEVMARFELPWWCYARADALTNMSAKSWALVRKSQLRMTYIGAESPSDWMLHEVRKGTRSDQTLEAVEVCRRQGVTPELSFMLAPPHDPEGETEKTFEFIRHIKRIHPAAEIVTYIYTPLPPASIHDCRGEPVEFPRTADEWAQPEWIAYWCHAAAPWVSERLRNRIRDFSTVLGCRFPTATDIRSPQWGKSALRALASWRYRFRRYDRPWELDWSKRVIRLWDPRASSL